MKTVTHQFEQTTGEGKLKYIVVFENVICSIITDIGTFSSLLVCFWFNHNFIGSKFLSTIYFFIWLIWVGQKTMKRSVKYNNPLDLVEKIARDLKLNIKQED